MTGNTKKIVMDIVLAALLAALACVATMLIQIPTPFKGYVNLGDGVVLVAGWILAPKYVFLAAGVGSALADLFSGASSKERSSTTMSLSNTLSIMPTSKAREPVLE